MNPVYLIVVGCCIPLLILGSVCFADEKEFGAAVALQVLLVILCLAAGMLT